MQPPLSHFTSPDFWSLYKRRPADVQGTADKYALLKSDPKPVRSGRLSADVIRLVCCKRLDLRGFTNENAFTFRCGQRSPKTP